MHLIYISETYWWFIPVTELGPIWVNWGIFFFEIGGQLNIQLGLVGITQSQLLAPTS